MEDLSGAVVFGALSMSIPLVGIGFGDRFRLDCVATSMQGSYRLMIYFDLFHLIEGVFTTKQQLSKG